MRVTFEEILIGETFVYREQLWMKGKDYSKNCSYCVGLTHDKCDKCNLGMIEEIAHETLVWKVNENL